MIGQILNATETNNLLVELSTIRSGDASKNQHQRLARFFGLLKSRLVIGDPAVGLRKLVGAMMPTSPTLTERVFGGEKNRKQGQKASHELLHEFLSLIPVIRTIVLATIAQNKATLLAYH